MQPSMTINCFLSSKPIKARVRARLRNRMARLAVSRIPPELRNHVGHKSMTVAACWVWPLGTLVPIFREAVVEDRSARAEKAEQRRADLERRLERQRQRRIELGLAA